MSFVPGKPSSLLPVLYALPYCHCEPVPIFSFTRRSNPIMILFYLLFWTFKSGIRYLSPRPHIIFHSSCLSNLSDLIRPICPIRLICPIHSRVLPSDIPKIFVGICDKIPVTAFARLPHSVHPWYPVFRSPHLVLPSKEACRRERNREGGIKACPFIYQPLFIPGYRLLPVWYLTNFWLSTLNF